MAIIRQELTAFPSTNTRQDPHSPSPQPSLVPLRPRSPRMNSSSVLEESRSRSIFTPLTVHLSLTMESSILCLESQAHARYEFSAAQLYRVALSGKPAVERHGIQFIPHFSRETQVIGGPY